MDRCSNRLADLKLVASTTPPPTTTRTPVRCCPPASRCPAPWAPAGRPWARTAPCPAWSTTTSPTSRPTTTTSITSRAPSCGDSFWQANATNETHTKSARYPALIPSPAIRRYHHSPSPSPSPSHVDAGDQPNESPSWPLPAEPINNITPRLNKSAYTLFPRPQLSPTRPTHPPRTSSFSHICPPSPARPHRPQNLSLPTVASAEARPQAECSSPDWTTCTTVTNLPY